MSEVDQLSRRVGAVALLLTTLWVLPASAEVAAPDSRTNVAVKTTASASNLAALSDSDAMAMAAKRKRKPAGIVRVQPTRVAALSRPDWGCYGSWCGRPFLLIIGIAY
jgi:hypothetical protein